VEIPTLDGAVALDVPRGIQPGKVLRLRGRGLPALHEKKKGDILVRVHVWIPEHPARRKRSFLRSSERSNRSRGAGEKRDAGWFERVRDAWGV